MEKYTDEQYEEIEKEIDSGQIEELLEESKDEFNLIDLLKGTDLDAASQEPFTPPKA